MILWMELREPPFGTPAFVVTVVDCDEFEPSRFDSFWRLNGARSTSSGSVSDTAGLPPSFDRRRNQLTRNPVTFLTPGNISLAFTTFDCTHNQPTQVIHHSTKTVIL